MSIFDKGDDIFLHMIEKQIKGIYKNNRKIKREEFNMKHIKEHIENKIETAKTGIVADELKKQLEILAKAEREGEGNLLKFVNRIEHGNPIDVFKLWCIHVPESGEQYVEEYMEEMTFDTAFDAMQECELLDVTGDFSTADILDKIIITDSLPEEKDPTVYYFVDNDTLDKITA